MLCIMLCSYPAVLLCLTYMAMSYAQYHAHEKIVPSSHRHEYNAIVINMLTDQVIMTIILLHVTFHLFI